jgi:ribosomal protein S18 acetylase RimI-like enzyme/DNA-binding MarR family transcriptional regulator
MSAMPQIPRKPYSGHMGGAWRLSSGTLPWAGRLHAVKEAGPGISDYSQRMDRSMVDQVRRFNRTVTQRIGALSDTFLSRDRPLGPARLLWEIGSDGCDVRLLRSRLGLDSGYLSRLLRSLENDGLAVVEQSGTDARVRTAHLTESGLVERAVLDQRSDDEARSILGPLSPRQRARLITAMAEVERLLMASAVQVAGCDPWHPDARSCLRAYFSELTRRFDGGFDPARSTSADDVELTPPAGLFLVATLYAEPVGCGAVKFHPGASAQTKSAQIKRMWVAPAARRLGLGRRLLADLEAHAAASGVRTLRLETNRALNEAIGMYRSAGYREVSAFNDEPYADHWFEKALDRTAGAGSE